MISDINDELGIFDVISIESKGDVDDVKQEEKGIEKQQEKDALNSHNKDVTIVKSQSFVSIEP